MGAAVTSFFQAFADAVALLQPLILTVTAVVGAAVALVGLQTWRKQLEGRTEYELARRFLRAALEARDAIENVRRPMMLGGEIQAAAEEAGIELDALGPIPREAIVEARERRWRGVRDALSALRVEELEAEVLWGMEAARCTDRLREAIKRVWMAEMEYNERTAHEMPVEEDRERLPQLRRIMYGSGLEDDDTARAIEAGLESIEAVIRPKLKL